MTTIYTGEEGKRIRMAMHQYFFECLKKNVVGVCVRLALGSEEQQND